MRQFIAVLVSVSIAFAGVTSADAGAPFLDPIYGVNITNDVLYGSGAVAGGSIDLYLDIYQPTDIGGGAVPELSPAVVIQHGGAWTSGDKGDAYTPATFLASYGFTILSAQYRLRGDNPIPAAGPWDSLDFPFTVQIFPGTNAIKAGIEDAGMAMAWTRNNAAAWEIDPNRIALAGASAGGIDALLYAYNDPAPISAPQAVIGLIASAYDSAGDNSQFDSNSPPAFFLNGVTDPIVPYDIPLTEAKMDAAGVYHDSNIHDLGFGVHDVEWDYIFQPGESVHHEGYNVLEAMQRFLALNLSGVSFALGDFDADFDVDGDDFLAWQAGFGIQAGAQKSDGDYDNDGDVDGDDFIGWQAEFSSPTDGAASVAVPEPASIACLVAMAAMGVLFRRGPRGVFLDFQSENSV